MKKIEIKEGMRYCRFDAQGWEIVKVKVREIRGIKSVVFVSETRTNDKIKGNPPIFYRFNDNGWHLLNPELERAIKAFELSLKIDHKALEGTREGLFDKLRKSKKSGVMP